MVSKILCTLPRGVFGHRIPPTGREQALSAPPRDSQLMHQEPSLPSCLDASCQSFSPLLQSPWFQIQCGLPCLLPDSYVSSSLGTPSPRALMKSTPWAGLFHAC